MNRSWTDNEGVAALSRVSEALETLAGAVPDRLADLTDAPGDKRVDLPIQNLPAHIRFGRIWAERGGPFLGRREPRRCPLCDGDDRVAWFPTQDGYRYDICNRCRMVYIPDVVPLRVWDQYFAELPDARDHLRSQMEATITTAAVARHRTRFARYFRVAAEHGCALEGARLLDVGTYTGASLVVAAELGMEAEGIEGLEEAVEFCRTRCPDLRVSLGHAEALPALGRQRFDLVTMWETLEHTLAPNRALECARQALATGGMLALTVPNARNVQCTLLREFCFYAYGGYQGIGHVNLFTPDTLGRALDQNGFDLVHIETEFGTDWRQLAYYVAHRFDRIYCYRNLLRNGEFMEAPDPELAVLLNWLSPALTRLENAWLAGPIIFALARRR